jgi:hypothetical protein
VLETEVGGFLSQLETRSRESNPVMNHNQTKIDWKFVRVASAADFAIQGASY